MFIIIFKVVMHFIFIFVKNWNVIVVSSINWKISLRKITGYLLKYRDVHDNMLYT